MKVISKFLLYSLFNCRLNGSTSRYLILDILGQGTFGQVVKCQNMKTHEIVAVKVVKNKPAYFNQSMMEVTILEMVSGVLVYIHRLNSLLVKQKLRPQR